MINKKLFTLALIGFFLIAIGISFYSNNIKETTEITQIDKGTTEDQVFQKLGTKKFEVKEFKVNKVKTKKLKHKDENFTVSNNFIKTPYGIKHEILIENKQGKDKDYNYSTVIEINYSEVRWNGTRYTLTSNPIRFGIVDVYDYKGEVVEIVAPNIFFDDVLHKRINYADMAERGGYALAYEQEGKYYIELRLDNIKIKAGKSYFLDPLYVNQTDGFNIGILGITSVKGMDLINASALAIVDTDGDEVKYVNTDGTNASNTVWTTTGISSMEGLTSNGTDILITDVTGDKVGRYDLVGNQISLISVIFWSPVPVGIAFSGSGSDFFVIANADGNASQLSFVDNNYSYTGTSVDFVSLGASSGVKLAGNATDLWHAHDTQAFVIHALNDGTNATGDFDTNVLMGASSPRGIAASTNGLDLWIADSVDDFVYHVQSEPDPINDAPIVTATIPENNSILTSNLVTFSGNASDDQNLTNVSLFINGLINQTNSTPFNRSQVNFTVTMPEGTIDWFYQASDNASQTTNSTGQRFIVNTTPEIFIIDPVVNNTNFTTSTIFFNATTSLAVDTWIVNYNGTNITLTAGINTSLEVEDGNNFHLLLYANNSQSGKFGLNDTLFFSVDANPPQINVTFPNETIGFHEFNTNLSINWTVSDVNLDACWFDWNGTNTTVTCLDNQTNLNITDRNNKNLTFYANDTLGNTNSSFITWNYKIFQNSINFSATTIGGSTEEFELNITKDSSLQISTVNLVYNSSSSAASFTAGDTSIVTASLDIPNPPENSSTTFFFSFTMSDASIINTSSNNQSVLNFGIGNCSTFSTLIYNFTLLDEENQTKLDNVTIEYSFNLFDSSRTTEITNFSFKSTTNPTEICINQNLTTTSLFSLDGVLKYLSSDDAYLTRYYNILNFSLTNSSVPNAINIYDVIDTTATPFQLTFRDSLLSLAPGILVNVNKQFVDSGDFKTVEIPITDSTGQTVLNLVRNIAVYNLIFINSAGKIVATFNEINAFCQDFTIGECTLNLDAPASTAEVFDPFTVGGISYTVIYTNSTSTATLTFSSLNSTAVTARIVGTTQNQFGNRSVCDNSLTSTLGTINCDASSILTSDNFLFIEIFSDGNYIETRTININPETPLVGGQYGFDGFFIAFLLLLVIIILFSEDKQVLLISLGLGWAVILILGLVKGSIIGVASGGIWLLISIITMIWKVKQEEIGR
jgi:hypothetical protein